MAFLTKEQIRIIFDNTLESRIPELNPNIQNTVINAFKNSNINIANALNDTAKEAAKDKFISTARRDALELKGQDLNIPILQASKASGLLVANIASAGQTFPADSEFIGNEISFSNPTVAISEDKNNVVLGVILNASGNTEITFTDFHFLGANLIFSANSIDFTVLSIVDDFTIEIEGDVTGDISATDNATYTILLVSVESVNVGISNNAENQNTIFSTNQTGFDDLIFYSTYGGIFGARDLETTENYRNRLLNTFIKGGGLTEQETRELLDRNGFSYIDISMPPAIEGGASGVPDVGETKVWCLRNNGALCNAQELSDVRDLILQNNYPVNSIDAKLEVDNATITTVNFTLSSVVIQSGINEVPASIAMQNAIIESLRDYFNSLSIGGNATQSSYLNAVLRSVDQFGNTVKSANIDTPTTDINTDPNVKLQLGSVTFV